MCRLVLDSNILISAFFWDGNERDLLRRCKNGEYHLIESDFILEEVEKVLQVKFNVEYHLARSFIREIFSFSEIVITKGRLDVIEEDPSDNRVLETAIYGKANYLITGDKHLLKLHDYQGIIIIKSADLPNK
ncbi:MAG: putative toxin-antitoxin system toxin component, PIN family [Thermoplasmatota archaeon]